MAVQRRLAAILAADVVGYSRMMGDDEEGTLAALTAHRTEMIEPCIAEHRGRVVKTTGDGLLVEFASVVDAVRCAIAFQEGMVDRNSNVDQDRRVMFRIGVNLGDVIIQDEDVFGDGVNVAARLEALAEPNGICISDMVHQGIGSKLDLKFEDLGFQRVKNIAKPIHVYQLLKRDTASHTSERIDTDKLFRRPAVAVLPFDNLSGDSEQEYFSDGLSEDVITMLSAWRSFPVIARNSSFAFKGQSRDVREVAKELAARYIIEGSVRKAGNRIRITAQLIDAETGHHLWADKFDGELADVFAIQDEITERIVTAVEPEMEKAELNKTAAKRSSNLNAWDYYLRGTSQLYLYTVEGNREARAMFEEAIALDASYGDAYAGLSRTYQRDIHFEAVDDRDEWETRALEAAHQAVKLDNGSSFAHLALSGAYIWSNQHNLAIAETRTAVDLNPSSVQARLALGNRLDIIGDPEHGIPILEEALALSPRDPNSHSYYAQLARANINARNYERALECVHESLRRKADHPHTFFVLAICLGHLGRTKEAKEAARKCEQLHPGFLEKRADWDIYLDPASNQHLLEGLRKAGLPEALFEENVPPLREAAPDDTDAALPLPDKPSIAVLPFANMSGDPEQEYFADGITEDIITAISRIRQFFVIARNTTFTYKGRAVDVQAVARELGVRYVVEGSVRKAGNTVRITVQLIDGQNGNHIWADRYDRELEDIFAVQDEITQNIASRLEPELSRAEYERARAKPPDNLDAWELYQRALNSSGRLTKEGNLEARRLFQRATELDPSFAPAFAGLSMTHSLSILLGDSEIDRSEALRTAEIAVALDDKDAFGHLALGRAYHHARSRDKSVEVLKQAVMLNPNSAATHDYLGLALMHAGSPNEALPHLELAIRLSPSDPEIGAYYARLGGANFFLGQYDEAIVWSRKAVAKVNLWIGYAYLAASLGYLGRFEEAGATRLELEKNEARFDLDFVRAHFPGDRPHLDLLIEGLKKAGFRDRNDHTLSRTSD